VNKRNPRFYSHRPSYLDVKWFDDTYLIWHPDDASYFEPPNNSYCYFRKTFNLPSVADKTEIRIFADSRYLMFINGHYIGRGSLRSDPRWQSYDTLDVTDHLAAGENLIAILAVYYGFGTGQYIPRRPALVAEGRFWCSGNELVTIKTDDTWKTSKALEYIRNVPRISPHQASIEVFDGREYQQGWNRIGYDDNKWVQALPTRTLKTQYPGGHHPFWNMVTRCIPMLEEDIIDAPYLINSYTIKEKPESPERLHIQLYNEREGLTEPAKAITPAPNTSVEANMIGEATVLTFDFGKIVTGYLQIDVTGPEGTILDVVYAEEIWKGVAFFEKNRRPIDRFILKDGKNCLETVFAWKAYRYAQITVRNHKGPVIIRRVGMRTRNYPMDKMGGFTCEDQQLMDLWEVSVHTLRLCMQDGFVDSSSREQQHWIGDGRWEAVMNYYITGDKRIHYLLLTKIAESQDWTGMVRPRYPDAHECIPPIPPYCLAWICSFADYALYSGDKNLLQPYWPNIVSALRWFTAYENADGLLADVPFWIFIDWSSGNAGKSLDVNRGGIVTAMNLQYLEALKTALCFAVEIGDFDAEDVYGSKIKLLSKSIRDQLWSDDRGSYVDCVVNCIQSEIVSEQTNCLALLHLHEPGDERAVIILKNLFSKESDSQAVICNPFFMTPLCKAMIKHGMTERSLEIFRERYVPMLDAGATATWETWELFSEDGGKVSMGSASHAWGAAPIIMFVEGILGISPLEPGYRRFSINPNLCGLSGAKGSIPTPNGCIRIAITKNGDRTAVIVDIPKNCAGVFRQTRELEMGKHEIDLF